jgi:hypothetical protein
MSAWLDPLADDAHVITSAGAFRRVAPRDPSASTSPRHSRMQTNLQNILEPNRRFVTLAIYTIARKLLRRGQTVGGHASEVPS